MSGFCGIIQYESSRQDTDIATAVSKMAAASPYRGQAHIYSDPQTTVGLACLLRDDRPSVKPSTKFASEGMARSPQHSSLTLVGDLRIDNRNELKAQLLGIGHLQKEVVTDADIALAAYIKWQADCANHLIGDFAFVVWDSNKRELFAACDQMGMRCIHYRWDSGTLFIATEVKQILAVQKSPASIHKPMLGVWLAGYSGDPTWSFYENIQRLPPAHALLAKADSLNTWQYWSIDTSKRIRYRHEDDYAEHFKELFLESVRCRISQQVTGLFLSGGVDSGSVAAAAGWCRQQDAALPELRAYCYAFETLSQCDERHISDRIAAHYGFPTSNIPAEAAYPLAGYPNEAGPDLDGPLMGAYTALHVLTLKTAYAEGCRVMLTGSHGDQMIGGGITDAWGLLRRGLFHTLHRELDIYAQWKSISRLQAANRLLGKSAIAALISTQGYDRLRQLRDQLTNRKRHSQEKVIPWWIDPDFAQSIQLADLLQKYPKYEFIGSARRQRRQVSRAPLESKGEIWGERLFARYGLVRADPWADLRLLEFVNAIPQHLINRLSESKRLAKQAMRNIVPEPARTAMGKIYPDRLYEQAMRDWAKDTFTDLTHNSIASRQGYLNGSALAQHYDAILRYETDELDFWPALTVEMWLRQCE